MPWGSVLTDRTFTSAPTESGTLIIFKIASHLLEQFCIAWSGNVAGLYQYERS